MTFAEVERRVRKAKPAQAADLWECAFLSLVEIDELLQMVKERAMHPSVYLMPDSRIIRAETTICTATMIMNEAAGPIRRCRGNIICTDAPWRLEQSRS